MKRRVLAVVGLTVVAAAAGWKLWSQQAASPQRVGAGVVSISSQPPGAAVFIDGAEVGRTPWFADNVWPSGLVEFELRLPGRQPKRGTFPGGIETRVELSFGTPRRRLARSDAGQSLSIDAGGIDVAFDDDPEARPHTRGPLRPPEAEFVDEDLDREAATTR